MALRGIRAAVVGAGIGGLSAALALARRGAAHVHVLERTTEARHGKLAGFGFGLAPNGLTVLRALGVLQSQVSGSDFASKLHPLRRHVNATASGVPLPFSPAAGLDIGFVRRDFGEYLSGVARADVVLALRAALAETNAIVSYETEVLGVSSDGSGQGKPATLALRKTGGTEQSESSPFDIIIAADGIHSTLRQHVYGPEVEGRQPPLFSGVNLYYGLTPASRLGNAGGDEACPPHTLVNLYGTGTSALYFGTGQAAPLVPPRGLAFRDDVFCRPAAYVWAIAHCEDAPAAESWGSAAVVEGLSAIATKHYAENKVLGAIIAAGLRDTASAAEGEVGQQPATFAHFGLFYRPPVAPWSRGPVVLLGDAAHATLPHAGQGANMAIDDAWCLVESLSQAIAGSGASVGIAQGLAAYEAARLRKTSDIVKMSHLLGQVSNVRNAALAAIRNYALGALAGSGALVKGLAAEIVKQPVIRVGPRS